MDEQNSCACVATEGHEVGTCTCDCHKEAPAETPAA